MRRQTTALHNERGAVLVIGFLVLTILAIIGVAATTSSRIEIDIVANDKSHKEALYAAELALIQGENLVDALPDRVTFDEDAFPERYGLTEPKPPAWKEPALWDNAHSIEVPLIQIPEGLKDAVDATSLPRYVVEEREFVRKRDSIGIGTGVPSGVYNWTITTRGSTSGTHGAQTMLQSMYARRYN